MKEKERELYRYLRTLPNQTEASHTVLLTSDLLHFLKILGYEGSTVFLEFLLSLRDRMVADALVAEHRTGPAWIIVEVKTFNALRNKPRRVWEDVKHSYSKFLTKDEQWLLMFSPKFLGLLSKSSDERFYDLTQLAEDQASEIYSFLRRPLQFSDGSSTRALNIGPGAPL